MKQLIVLAAATALFACSEAQAPEEVVEEPEVAAADVPDGGPVMGSYSVVEDSGASFTWTNNEDGTFTREVEGEEPTGGTWTMEGREFCYDPDGDEMGEDCLQFADAAEDGSWVSTRADGSTSTVKRIEEEAAEEAPAE